VVNRSAGALRLQSNFYRNRDGSQFYTTGGLNKHLVNSDKVEVATLESFVGRANQGKL
jgi:hypothetical protein